jgi:hypothetical protein
VWPRFGFFHHGSLYLEPLANYALEYFISDFLLVLCCMEIIPQGSIVPSEFAPKIKQRRADVAGVHGNRADDVISADVSASGELKVAGLVSKDVASRHRLGGLGDGRAEA